MSTYATVVYDWVHNYKSFWECDGNPGVVLPEEIIPLVEKHAQNPEKFYKEFLSLTLIPADEHVDFQDYTYIVRRSDREGMKIFTLEIKKGGGASVEIDLFLDDKTAVFQRINNYPTDELNDLVGVLKATGYKAIPSYF